jgi:hypothetical protein
MRMSGGPKGPPFLLRRRLVQAEGISAWGAGTHRFIRVIASAIAHKAMMTVEYTTAISRRIAPGFA